MAEVFLATDMVLERSVALKMMHPHLIHREETRRRFFNEARSIAQLSHDNIVRVYDYGTGERPFIAMEYIEGLTLASALEQSETLSNQTVLELGLQVLRGLEYTHRKGICHRDIKPANLIIDRNGLVRITDFGIAHLVNAESMTLTGSIVGSPHFIAPEQFSGGPVSAKTDIFSLGIVLYLCCTGTLPFSGDTPHAVINALLHARPDRASDTHPRVLIKLAAFIDECISKDPGTRPDASSAATQLQTIADDIGLQLGPNRVVLAGAPAETPRAQDDRELFELCCARAKRSCTLGATIQALRAFEQASRFGELTAEDEKVRNRLRAYSENRTGRIMAIVLGIVIAGAVVTGLLSRQSITAGPAPRQTPPESAANAAPIPSNASAVVKEIGVGVPATALLPAPPRVSRSRTVATLPPVTAADITKENIDASPLPQTSDVATEIGNGAQPGYLVCRTNPPWVTLTIDGIESGQTPTAPVAMAGGPHRIALNKRGFVPYEKLININPAETTKIRFQLDSIGASRADHE